MRRSRRGRGPRAIRRSRCWTARRPFRSTCSSGTRCSGRSATAVCEPGDRFPSEAAIRDRYRVSRATVRQALGDLEAGGVIRKVQGLGSFVAVPKIRHVPLLTSFTELASEPGVHAVAPGALVLGRGGAGRRRGRARPCGRHALSFPSPALPGRRQRRRTGRDVAPGRRARRARRPLRSRSAGRGIDVRGPAERADRAGARPRGRDDLARRGRRTECRAAGLRSGDAGAADPPPHVHAGRTAASSRTRLVFVGDRYEYRVELHRPEPGGWR